jgi:hypothetical protein
MLHPDIGSMPTIALKRSWGLADIEQDAHIAPHEDVRFAATCAGQNDAIIIVDVDNHSAMHTRLTHSLHAKHINKWKKICKTNVSYR